jgi:hypothetical protein
MCFWLLSISLFLLYSSFFLSPLYSYILGFFLSNLFLLFFISIASDLSMSCGAGFQACYRSECLKCGTFRHSSCEKLKSVKIKKTWIYYEKLKLRLPDTIRCLIKKIKPVLPASQHIRSIDWWLEVSTLDKSPKADRWLGRPCEIFWKCRHIW